MSPQFWGFIVTPNPLGLTADLEDLGGAGAAMDVAGGAAVIPAVPGPCTPHFQPQGIAGGGDTELLAQGGHLSPAGGQHGAIVVDGQRGRRVAVHGAADNDQPATLGLLEERQGGNSGWICEVGEDVEVAMWAQGKSQRGH